METFPLELVSARIEMTRGAMWFKEDWVNCVCNLTCAHSCRPRGYDNGTQWNRTVRVSWEGFAFYHYRAEQVFLLPPPASSPFPRGTSSVTVGKGRARGLLSGSGLALLLF